MEERHSLQGIRGVSDCLLFQQPASLFQGQFSRRRRVYNHTSIGGCGTCNLPPITTQAEFVLFESLDSRR